MTFIAKYGNSIARYGDAIFNISGVSFGKAIGGTITTYGNFKVHSFTTSGIFQMIVPIDCSVLILGNGGQGGTGVYQSGGGAGGAGGICIETVMNLINSSYPVVIGNYPSGSCSFNGQTASGGSSGGNNSGSQGGTGGSNASYSGRNQNNGVGGGGAGSRANATNPLYRGGSGAVSSISGSSVEYGKGGDGGGPGMGYVNGTSAMAGIVIIRYRFQ
jgi:hypothetical protein